MPRAATPVRSKGCVVAHRQLRWRASRPPGCDRCRAYARARAGAQGRRADFRAAPAPIFPAARCRCFSSSSERDKLRLLAAAGLDGAIVMTFDEKACLDAGARLRRADPGRAASASPARRSASISISARTAAGSPQFLAEQGASAASRSISCRRWRTKAGRSPPARVRAGACGRQSRRGGGAARRAVVRLRRGHSRREARPRRSAFRPRTSGSTRPAGSKHGIYAVRVGVGRQVATTAWRASAGGRRSTTARRCSKCSCSISPVISTAQTIDVAFIGWIRPRGEIRHDRGADPRRWTSDVSAGARASCSASQRRRFRRWRAS